ncbi:hypothetical protein [Olivibacter sp. XZL3]|uniref:hypothetical protein n=1 Tax=Olivibacter sp. XZL3 TaxID=1735116 RepID=UPI001066535C|nr:hypothetical protein [Olivibacter sp. XZL3]
MNKQPNETRFRLHGDVVAVRGKRCSALYNFHTGSLSLIDHAFHDAINYLQRVPYAQVSPQHLDFLPPLLDGEFGYLTNNHERFQPIPLEHHPLDAIQHALVEYHDGMEAYDPTELLGELDVLGCQHLELRLHTDATGTEVLNRLTQWLANLTFSSIHLVLSYREAMDTAQLFERIPALSRITFRNAPQEGKDSHGRRQLYYQRGPMDPIGYVPQLLRIVSRRFYSEALQFNPYYHRRIAIDRWGYIRHDLGHHLEYGHIHECSIQQVYNSPTFRECWTANADRIEELQDDPCRYAIHPMVPLTLDRQRNLYTFEGYMSNYQFY